MHLYCSFSPPVPYVHFAYAFVLQLLARPCPTCILPTRLYCSFWPARALRAFCLRACTAVLGPRALRSQVQMCYAHLAYAPIILRAPASSRATACSVNCLFATQVSRNSLLGPRTHGVKYCPGNAESGRNSSSGNACLA